MQQLDLCDPDPRALARRGDPSTSHDAAARVREFGQAQRALILATLKRFGRAGAEQIAAATKLDAYQVRKRLPELEEVKRVRVVIDTETQSEVTRKTASGRKERVWEPVK